MRRGDDAAATDRPDSERQAPSDSGLARIAALVDSLGDGIFEVDLERGTVWWSDRIHELVGTTPGDYPSTIEQFRRWVHPDDREQVMRGLEVALERGHRYTGKFRLRRASGEYLWVYARADVLKDESGRVVSFVGAQIDLTAEVRRAERLQTHVDEAVAALSKANQELFDLVRVEAQAKDALRAEQRRLMLILDGISALVAYVDQTETHSFANTGFREFFGGEVVGRSVIEVMGPAAHEALRSSLAKALSGQPVLLEFSADIAGTPRWLRFDYIPDIQDDGETRGVFAVLTDLSEPREDEQTLPWRQEVEVIGRLAAGVAHDFNNLLTVLFTAHQELADLSGGDARYAGVVEAVEGVAVRGAALTAQLLTIGHNDESSSGPVGLDQTIADLDGLLSRLVEGDIELSVDLTAPGALVSIGPGELSRLVINLVLNARDAMRAGGRLQLRSRLVEVDDVHPESLPTVGPRRYVEVTVEGVAVAANETTTSPAYDPLLARELPGMIREVVESAKGSVELESTGGEGTRVRVLLPAFPQQRADRVQPGNVSLAAPVPAPLRVLLVEDENAVRQELRRILLAAGWEVISAATPAEALGLSQHCGPFDVVLTDLVMPQMDGVEFANAMIPYQSTVRFVFISGDSNEGLARHRELPEGATLLRRPFSPAELLEVLGSGTAPDFQDLPAHDERPAWQPEDTPRVLLVDDDVVFTRSITRALESAPWDFAVALGALEARALLERTRVDAIVLDMHLGAVGESQQLLDWLAEYRAPLFACSLLITGGPFGGAGEQLLSNHGRVVRKPFHPDRLAREIREMLRLAWRSQHNG